MSPLSNEDISKAVPMLGRVVEAFVEDVDGEPSLGEVLEVLSLSVPAGNPRMGASPIPLKFKAEVDGNRSYRAPKSSRVFELNDNTFVEAAELLGFLVNRGSALTGEDTSPAELADYILQLLKVAHHPLADISSDAVSKLAVDVPKRLRKAKVGDVVAIPAAGEGYNFAVVVCRDNWGVAVGLLKGVHPTLRLEPATTYEARHVPLYSSEGMIKDGAWPIVGHDEDLLALFPDLPEVYFTADNPFGENKGLATLAMGPGTDLDDPGVFRAVRARARQARRVQQLV